jgi:hypothetical protein
LLGEFGKERGPSFLERREPDPELFQLAVDALQLGPGLPFPEVPLTMSGADQILDLTAEQPRPRSQAPGKVDAMHGRGHHE